MNHDCCSKNKSQDGSPEISERKTIDPVCGMEVDPAHAKGGSHSFEGRTYFFCHPGCQAKFAAEPLKYLLKKEAGPPSKLELEAEYTCPMHPEVRQLGPGDCPKCGMALEPAMISLDQPEDNSELNFMKRRFKMSALFSLPLVFLATGRHLLPTETMHATGSLLQWLEFALATPVVAWGGWPFFRLFLLSIRNRNPNMFTLIGLGTAVAYLYSLAAVLFPSLFPDGLRDPHSGLVGVYFEAAVVIVTLELLGQVLELKARAQTGGGIGRAHV